MFRVHAECRWLASLIVVVLLAGCESAQREEASGLEALLHARPRLTFTGGAANSGWLPTTHATKPVVAGRAGSEPVRVLLDTGADITVVDRVLTDRLGLATRGEGSAVGTGGLAAAVRAVDGFSLELGALRLDDVPAITMDLTRVRKKGAGPPIVILGAQVFQALVADFDLPKKRVALRRRDELAAPRDGVVVPLKPVGKAGYAMDVVIEGTPVQLLLDTGAAGSVDLFAETEVARRFRGRASRSAGVGGVGGVVAARTITLSSTRVAGREFTDLTSAVFSAGRSELLEDGVSGLLGSKLLAQFRVVLDCSARRAVVTSDDSVGGGSPPR